MNESKRQFTNPDSVSVNDNVNVKFYGRASGLFYNQQFPHYITKTRRVRSKLFDNYVTAPALSSRNVTGLEHCIGAEIGSERAIEKTLKRGIQGYQRASRRKPAIELSWGDDLDPEGSAQRQ